MAIIENIASIANSVQVALWMSVSGGGDGGDEGGREGVREAKGIHSSDKEWSKSTVNFINIKNICDLYVFFNCRIVCI